MYLFIFSSPVGDEVYHFKNKKDLTKYFSFEEISMYGNCEIYKVNKIENPILFYRKE